MSEQFTLTKLNSDRWEVRIPKGRFGPTLIQYFGSEHQALTYIGEYFADIYSDFQDNVITQFADHVVDLGVGTVEPGVPFVEPPTLLGEPRAPYNIVYSIPEDTNMISSSLLTFNTTNPEPQPVDADGNLIPTPTPKDLDAVVDVPESREEEVAFIEGEPNFASEKRKPGRPKKAVEA